MVTAFSEIYGYVRALLGDTDPECRVYDSTVIDSHIRLVAMRLNEFEASDSDATFTSELSKVNKCRVIFRVTRSIISPIDAHFSYRSPVLSIVRQGGSTELRRYLDQQIYEIENSESALSADFDANAMVQGALRWMNQYNAALADVPSDYTT